MRTLLFLIGLTGIAAITALGWMRSDAGSAPTLTYHANGRLQTSTCYVAGVRDGAATEWHANGQKHSEGTYAQGFREGSWTFWNEDGSVDLDRSGIYREGKRVDALGADGPAR